MFALIVVEIMLLLAIANEVCKGDYLCAIIFVVFNVAIIYICIKAVNITETDDSKKEDSSNKNILSDEDIEDLILFDMINKKIKKIELKNKNTSQIPKAY